MRVIRPADGLATAIMVMGPEKGIDLINRLDSVEGLIIVEQMDGSLADYYSKGFNVQNLYGDKKAPKHQNEISWLVISMPYNDQTSGRAHSGLRCKTALSIEEKELASQWGGFVVAPGTVTSLH